MNIYIKTLSLRNFKGIKSLTIPFTHETNIFGENASGKTTVFDAFLWLFFGKDSSDRKDFNIKTLDKNNKPIHKQEHEVAACINVDGVDINIKRILTEKWVTKRGENVPEFTGHETEFKYNDVPMSQAEYQTKINAILQESIFKLITNALYFNQMKWQDRRNVLVSIAGTLTNEMVIAELKATKSKSNFDNLLFILQNGKSLEEYKREIGAKKKIIKNDIILIPPRIEEVKRGMPVEEDYDAIQKQIDESQNEINTVEASISNKNEAYQKEYAVIREKQNTIHQHKTRRTEISFEIRTKLSSESSGIQQKRNAFTNKISVLEQDLQSKNNLLASTQNKKEEYSKQLDALRIKWTAINAEELVIDEHGFNCPVCKRRYEENAINRGVQQQQENFTEDKNRRLESNKSEGIALKAEIEKCENLIETLQNAIKTIDGDLNLNRESLDLFDKTTNIETPSLDEQLANNDEYVELGAKLVTLEKEVNEVPLVDDAELKSRRNSLILQRDSLKVKLNNKGVIERANARIKELELEEQRMAQEIANLEQSEFLVEDFTKAKMTIITDRINSRFKYVTFKMFEQQINGGEVECCETLINGVPFSDANNAARINAGIDIINVLCEHYSVWAPIFIDNRESVSELIPCKSQIVNLVVLKGAKLSVNEPEYTSNHLAVA